MNVKSIQRAVANLLRRGGLARNEADAIRSGYPAITEDVTRFLLRALAIEPCREDPTIFRATPDFASFLGALSVGFFAAVPLELHTYHAIGKHPCFVGESLEHATAINHQPTKEPSHVAGR